MTKEQEEQPQKEPIIIELPETDDEKLNRLLGGSKAGWQASISRVRPSWCSGYLETVELSDDYPLDLDYLSTEWGGQTLRIKVKDGGGKIRGGTDLNFASFPPRFRGKVVTPQNPFPNQVTEPPVYSQTQPPQLSQSIQPQQQAPQVDFTNLFETARKARAEDFEQWQKLAKANMPAAVPEPLRSGIDDVLELGKKYKQLQGIFGGAEQQLSAEPETKLFNMIGKVIESINTKKQPDPPATRARVENRQPSKADVVHLLSSYDHNTAADVCFNALKNMSEEKRQKTMEAFSNRLESIVDINYSDEEDEEEDNDERNFDDTENTSNSDSRSGSSPGDEDDT